MTSVQWIAAVLLGAAALMATWRLLIGPTTPDRFVAGDALAVMTTAALAGLAYVMDNPIYLDVALIYGALAFVGVVALARVLEGTQP